MDCRQIDVGFIELVVCEVKPANSGNDAFIKVYGWVRFWLILQSRNKITYIYLMRRARRVGSLSFK